MTRFAWTTARTALVAGAALAASQASLGAIIMSDFAADEDGWSANLPSAQSAQPHAGNATGYFMVMGSGAVTPQAFAAAKFLGNQSHAMGGTFSFDVNVVETQLAHSAANYFARVTIVGSSGSATYDFAPVGNMARFWQHHEIEMSAAAWGLTNGQFSALVSDIQSIGISVINVGGFPPVEVGYDNVMITPTPGAAALLAIGLPAALRRRRQA